MNPFKSLLPAVLLLLNTTASFSQKQKSLTISVGTSLPLGSFASTASTAPGQAAGFAAPGIFVDALFQKNISQSKFSLGALLAMNMNFFRINTVISNYQKNSPMFTWTGKHSNWLSIAAMPGICYNTPLSGKTSFTAGLFTGPVAVYSPSFTINGTIPATVTAYQGQAESIRKSAWGISIASRLSAGLQFQAGKKTTLVAQAGYTYLKPTFGKIVQSFTQVTQNSGSNLQQYASSHSEFAVTQSISTVNAGIGILLSLK